MASGKDNDTPVIVLFRDDLRISDNRALSAAVETERPVVPLYVLDDSTAIGGARKWWLHHSLASLAEDLAGRGSGLVLRRGKTRAVVDALVAETGAGTVFWNRRYNPPGMTADAALKRHLRKQRVEAESFDGELLHEPSLVKTGSGSHYRVFTPFRRALDAQGDPRPPLPAPRRIRPMPTMPESDDLDQWGLLPRRPDWAAGLRKTWRPGEDSARGRLADFLGHGIEGYAEARDFPAEHATSMLSPHLAHGEITPYQIWHAIRRAVEIGRDDAAKFRAELVWREFCHHLLFHNPDLAETNFDRSFDAFPWTDDGGLLAAWRHGRTGYPIVDAGMRQLWETGWMHNRVRMVAASFLVKHLLIDWRHGELWFRDTLVDADPASNAANWQWVAGSGADAAPYFRIFNPILQGEKFDPDGAYVRRWVPEIAALPDRFVHQPWEAPPKVLEQAGIAPGTPYAKPVVGHRQARERALQAYKTMRGVA